ncbi:MAG: hypothetical protein H0X24_10125 [Ktedonobacterales bacterium]|nr:hypothetical protein [Ktedonobacterales bacterium]
MTSYEEDYNRSGSYPRASVNRPDFADHEIAEQMRGTLYSWERLPTVRKHEVMSLVRRTNRRRHSRLVAVLFVLVLLLVALAAVGVYLFMFAPHLGR